MNDNASRKDHIVALDQSAPGNNGPTTRRILESIFNDEEEQGELNYMLVAWCQPPRPRRVDGR